MTHTPCDSQLQPGYAEQESISDQFPADGQKTRVADGLLLIAADTLDDIERVRIATANRLQSLVTPPSEGERGGWFGKGIPPEHPDIQQVQAILGGVERLEHEAERNLKRAMRAHYLGGWVARTIGVGEKQAARLLAAIGDPAGGRTVRQLYRYCGMDVVDQANRVSQNEVVDGNGRHPEQRSRDGQGVSIGVAPQRIRGQKITWNPTARVRVWLIAVSCVKQAHSPYRAVYDAGRKKYADATHPMPCKRCGPAGTPAELGSKLSAGHQHARAMRLVAKQILKDLWNEARRIQPQNGGHTSTGMTSPDTGG